MSHFPARSRPRAAGEVSCVGNLDLRRTYAASAMSELVDNDGRLRRAGILQLHSCCTWSRRTFAHPKIEIRERCIENVSDQARIHQRNLRIALCIEWPVHSPLRIAH